MNETKEAEYVEIERCRLTGSSELVDVLSLGHQHLTGVFPKSRDEHVTAGPLDLVFSRNGGLLQLKQTYNLAQMYGANYGYRSGLNSAMVAHLGEKVRELESRVPLKVGDIVLDIGSNDGTLLGSYSDAGQSLVGIDPSAGKFRNFYPKNIHVIVDFFSARAFRQAFPRQKAKIVTSIAMLYDLEDPLSFARDVASVLDENGIWHFEQSYLPLMLQRNAYDTVCHEHLEYYSLHQIKWMTDRAGLKILDVETNDINGGSFAVTVGQQTGPYEQAVDRVMAMLANEEEIGLLSTTPFQAFRSTVERHRDDIKALVRKIKSEGKTVAGLGASTKGNVLLQYCGFTNDDIDYISEVNPDKFGCFTPGSLIPIVAESHAASRMPDYMLVLPWHFRSNLIERERGYLQQGGKLIFPLPVIEIVGAEGNYV